MSAGSWRGKARAMPAMLVTNPIKKMLMRAGKVPSEIGVYSEGSQL